MARPPEPRRPPADERFHSVHLWRRNRDGNEESTGRIGDEVRRIAANIAKSQELMQKPEGTLDLDQRKVVGSR
jgi:hypothetical protein